MKTEKKKTTPLERVLTIVGIALAAFFLPFLIINLTLLIKSYTSPEEVPGLLGITPMVVVTDSMTPTIRGGDMIVTKKSDPSEVRPGDIIAFFDPLDEDHEAVITHRVTDIFTKEGEIFFQTKGDANSAEDPPVPGKNLVGIYSFKIPVLGSVVLFMRTPTGVFLTVIIPILAVVLYDLIRRKAYETKQKEENAALREKIRELEQESA